MHDFESIKREIISRVDLLDVVSEHVSLKRRGQRWVGLCPFHTEKTPSFTVSPERGLFKCFGCGQGGDLFSFVSLKENVPFIEAMGILADRAGVELSRRPGADSGGASRSDLAKANDWALRWFRSNLRDEALGRSARKYLCQRQVSETIIERFGLGFTPGSAPLLEQAARRAGFDRARLVAADLLRQGDDGRVYDTFRNRLMFPIRDATGRVVGFGGRTLVDDRAKYVNTRQTVLFEKGSGLYGVDLARDAIVQRGRAIVVEGYFDCLAAHQAGFGETVATLGTAMTDRQVDLLRRYGDRIIVLFDSDEAGVQAAERAIQVALPRCVAVRLAHIPDGKDPSDFLLHRDSEAFSDVLNGAVAALEFKWQKTVARFDAHRSDAGRREAILDFLRVVSEAFDTRAVDAIQRGLLVNQVARLLRIDPQEVHALTARLRRGRTSRASEVARGPAVPRITTPVSEEQTAWRHVLEVLLNKPDLLRVVEGLPDVEGIADPRDCRIARIILEWAGTGGALHLTDVLARCLEPGDAERVAELAQRGAGGNHEAKLRVAVERIRRASPDDEMERSKQRYANKETDLKPFEDSRDQFAEYVQGLRAHRHFVPRRRKGSGDTTRTPSDRKDEPATMEPS